MRLNQLIYPTNYWLKNCANTDKNGFFGVLPVQAKLPDQQKNQRKTYKNLNTKKILKNTSTSPICPI